MGSNEILSLVCLGATALFALLTLGLAGLVLKLYTEYFKDQRHARRQATAPRQVEELGRPPALLSEENKAWARAPHVDAAQGGRGRVAFAFRDPEAPCDRFDVTPTQPGDFADCETDGHYLCRMCRWRRIAPPVDDGIPTDLEERMQAREREWNEQEARAEAEAEGEA